MATVIGGFRTSAPTTDFNVYADRIGQSVEGNYTVVRIYVEAVNQGYTGSYNGYPGYQKVSISGILGWTGYSANPFMPSGYATGQRRWMYHVGDIHIPHGDDGTRGAISIAQSVYANNGYGGSGSYSFNDFPDIPRGPRIKVGSTWKNSVAYVKVGSTWKIAIPYVKVGSTWKIGGG